MKSGRKGQRFILSLIVCCILLCNTAFAGTWEYRDNKWYCTDTGWVLCNSGWFYVGKDNVMLTNTYVDGYYLSYTGRMINESVSERSVNRFIQAMQVEDIPKFEVDVSGKDFVKAAGGKNIFGPFTTRTEDGTTYGWYADNLYEKMRADADYLRTALEPIVINLIGKTEQDIISLAHDATCGLLEYGSETNAASSIKIGKGACGTYAIVFKYLLNACGIDCDYVAGYANGVPHAWNRVYTSGGAYLVDVCWDDSSRSRDWYMKVTLPGHIEIVQ